MQSVLARFLGFDHLLGPALVKIVYYVGAVVIVCVSGFAMLMGLLAIFGGNLGAGIMQLLAVPAVGAVTLVYWRFVCELFMLAFLAYERLGEVRDTLRIAAGMAAAPDPDHPQF
jgi:hypothetical protein